MRLRLIVLAGLSAILAGCLLLPGKFDSAIDVRRDGAFHFHYAGEIVYLPLTQAAQSQMKAGGSAAGGEQAEVFTEEACTKPDSSETRPCTADELAAQHSAWDARKHGPSGAPQAGAMLAMMGGLNPGDPNAAATFADTLRRQAGWRKVVSKGNGVFDVEYDIAGRLDHDFTFPTLEHIPLMVPFVSVTRRADGSVRIEAPGFAPGLGNMGAMGAMGAMGSGAKAAPNPLKGVPPMDGTFAVTTDGTIATNNTEDGPAPAGAGSQRLTWKINAGHGTTPTALIRLN
jgi:hypothetical protein